jgi:hypothetical protein
MKIYLSGKISGLPFDNVFEKFEAHALLLEKKGYNPINPLNVSPFKPEKEWSDYMIDDIAELFKCEAIYMLDDWGQSIGARIEYGIARELGLKIMFAGEFNSIGDGQ